MAVLNLNTEKCQSTVKCMFHTNSLLFFNMSDYIPLYKVSHGDILDVGFYLVRNSSNPC